MKSLIIITVLSIASYLSITSFTTASNLASINTNDDGGKDTIVAKKLIPAGNLEASIGGCNGNKGGNLKALELLSYMGKVVCTKDAKTNTNYPVSKFDLLYCERTMGEDSIGMPIFSVEYTGETIEGDKVPEKWMEMFKERLYKGDTLKVNNIYARKDGKVYKAKNEIIVIVQ
jgi:hypothetical protein